RRQPEAPARASGRPAGGPMAAPSSPPVRRATGPLGRRRSLGSPIVVIVAVLVEVQPAVGVVGAGPPYGQLAERLHLGEADQALTEQLEQREEPRHHFERVLAVGAQRT